MEKYFDVELLSKFLEKINQRQWEGIIEVNGKMQKASPNSLKIGNNVLVLKTKQGDQYLRLFIDNTSFITYTRKDDLRGEGTPILGDDFSKQWIDFLCANSNEYVEYLSEEINRFNKKLNIATKSGINTSSLKELSKKFAYAERLINKKYLTTDKKLKSN